MKVINRYLEVPLISKCLSIKMADKEEAYNNKKHWNKPFEDYSYLPKPNLSASDSISHSKRVYHLKH